MKKRLCCLILALVMIMTISSCSSANTVNSSNTSSVKDISEYLELADAYADSGDFNKAIKTIENALKDIDSDALRLKLELLKEERDNSRLPVYSSETSGSVDPEYKTSENTTAAFFDNTPETTTLPFLFDESSETLSGKYEYNSGRFYCTLEFKSNGTCILTDDIQGYDHSRPGTYNYDDGKYLLSFKIDDFYAASTFSAVIHGEALTLTQLSGIGTKINGEFIRMAESDAPAGNHDTPITLSGKYRYEGTSNQYILEFRSDGICIGYTGLIGAKVMHSRTGSYEYADGEYIITLPFDSDYLETVYGAVLNGDELTVKVLGGKGPLTRNKEFVFYKTE